MLKKLAFWGFFSATGVMLVLASYVPWVRGIAHRITVRPLGFDAPILIIVPGVIAAIAAQLGLHNQLSNLLRIRERFDIGTILRPLAENTGVSITPMLEERLREERDPLMRKVFYPYASTRDTGCVNPHNIHMALTYWSWYWVALEYSLYASIGAVLATFGGEHVLAGLLIVSIAIAYLLTRLALDRATRYAEIQVEEIVSSPERRAAIRSVFDALQGPRPTSSQ